jgi:hypothetical protein
MGGEDAVAQTRGVLVAKPSRPWHPARIASLEPVACQAKEKP